VPRSVLDELQDSDAPAEVRAWVSAPPVWLQISTLIFRLDPLLDRLDQGEQDAILLAEAVKAERLIIDDLEGRREAANRGLPVIGTLGILAEAARRNLLDLPQVLDALRATNFHVAPDLIKLLLANDAKRRK
jgi:predicted nucleic acid-binding protein